MTRQPAVVFVARHGSRLDAADQSWHLSTPTPYDPPLTYGGWTQCRSLGLRIASLLHAREQEANAAGEEEGADLQESAQVPEKGQLGDRRESDARKKRRRVKHRVVIHTSPFLRCLQTSVAVAAGLAQYNPTIETAEKQGNGLRRSASLMHSSARSRAAEASGSPQLAPISEPKIDALKGKPDNESKPMRKSKVRVDAFLGEWLNPQYFDQITPPPPSSMMVATAKAELMQNEPIASYTPAVNAAPSPATSLWGGSNGSRPASGDRMMDDSKKTQDASTNPVSPRRERANTHNSFVTQDSGSMSAYKPGSSMQAQLSTEAQSGPSLYDPPTPHYAVSSSDPIPRGYVAHARNACASRDFQWDSSRHPQQWGDGGELGEEWSVMHRRFRNGLNKMIHWYSEHGIEDRAEDALGFDQAEQLDGEEDEEELVVVLITHGAGGNALLGALTGQPVLMDVGMASLSMAVRREGATVTSPGPTKPHPDDSRDFETALDKYTRRSSIDSGLSAIYEMKLVASSDHLRPSAADLSRTPSMRGRSELPAFREAPPSKYRPRFSSASAASSRGPSSTTITNNPPNPPTNPPPNDFAWSFTTPARTHSATSATSLRRPSTTVSALNTLNTAGSFTASPTQKPLSEGLWTPTGDRTPSLFALADGKNADTIDEEDPMLLDFSTSPADSRPTSQGEGKSAGGEGVGSLDGRVGVASPGVEQKNGAESTLWRSGSPKGLWGSGGTSTGDGGWGRDEKGREGVKRRWTVEQR